MPQKNRMNLAGGFEQPPAQTYGARPATAVPGPKSTAKPSGPVDAWMQGGTQKSSLL